MFEADFPLLKKFMPCISGKSQGPIQKYGDPLGTGSLTSECSMIGRQSLINTENMVTSFGHLVKL